MKVNKSQCLGQPMFSLRLSTWSTMQAVQPSPSEQDVAAPRQKIQIECLKRSDNQPKGTNLRTCNPSIQAWSATRSSKILLISELLLHYKDKGSAICASQSSCLHIYPLPSSFFLFLSSFFLNLSSFFLNLSSFFLFLPLSSSIYPQCILFLPQSILNVSSFFLNLSSFFRIPPLSILFLPLSSFFLLSLASFPFPFLAFWLPILHFFVPFLLSLVHSIALIEVSASSQERHCRRKSQMRVLPGIDGELKLRPGRMRIAPH